jgi:nucleoside-diphosphate-sugar epimerase
MEARASERLDLCGRRVVVTGGHGFLGKHVVAALVARGATAVPLGRAEVDLTAPAAVRACLAALSPFAVVHAAASGGGIGWMKEHPATALRENVLMNTAVLDASAACGVRRLALVSSACAYARDAAQPMREEVVFEGEPEPTNGPYGWSKRLAMVHARALAQESGLDSVVAVPTNLYGPGERVDPVRSHVVGALVRRFVEAAARGSTVETCWGSGQATRDLLHAADAAEGLVRLLEVGGGPEPVNLGSGVERTIAEIAETIAGAAGFRGEVRWDRSRPDGMPRKVLDISRMTARTAWRPSRSFEEGARETVAWFRSSS